MSILQQYLDDPWHWLRESDLVVDVVSRLRESLPTKVVDARLTGPGFDRRLVDSSSRRRQIHRVKAEVKIVRSAKDSSEEDDNSLHSDRDRIDVCVLVDDHIVDVIIYEKGARDVVLKMLEGDIAALLEVKMYPDLYIEKCYCGWLDDLVKLARVAPDATRGVLYLDTGLPLESIAANFCQKRGESNSLRRVVEHLPPWPIIEGDSFAVRYRGQDGTTNVINFSAIVDPPSEGLCLWALAVRRSSNWESGFVSRLSKLLPTSDVTPCCWQVSVAPER